MRNFQTNFHSGYAKFTFLSTGYSVLFLHDILNKSSHIKVQLDIFLVFDWEDTWDSFIWKSVSLNIALKLVYPSLLPMLINNSVIIHPKLRPAAWKSFLILPVFYSLCSISRQVPVNLTSNHQACLPPSTSAVASSVQVLIFAVLTGLSCESRSHDFLHPTAIAHGGRDVTWHSSAWSPFRALYCLQSEVKTGWAWLYLLGSCLPLYFPPHDLSHCVLWLYQAPGCFPEKLFQDFIHLHLQSSILCHSKYGPWTSSINITQELITESESMF